MQLRHVEAGNHKIIPVSVRADGHVVEQSPTTRRIKQKGVRVFNAFH